MVLPARIKASLPEESESTIVVTRGFEPCLTIYPLNEWKKIFEKVSSLNEFNPEYRRFQRNFLRGNTEIELDKSGRFLIPRTMARFAKLDKEAILVGMGNRIEIWNPDMYDEYLISDPEEFSALANNFLGEKQKLEEKAKEVASVNLDIEEKLEKGGKTGVANDKEEGEENEPI
jgi:MraZ protein